MLRLFLFYLTLYFFVAASGQQSSSVELSLISRYDQHANYVTNYANRSYNDTMKLYGLSHGVSIQYRKPVSRSYAVYFGAGYHRLGVDKISSSLPFRIPGVATSRSINNEDDDSTRLGYGTSKYHYNNVAFTVGLSKLFVFKGGFTLDAGVEAVGYYSFSQGYRLMNKYRYQTHHPKPLELGINATLGLLKEYDAFYIRPALLVPVYQNLKGDKAFYESRDMNVAKWFKGLGVLFRIGTYL